MLPPPMFWGLLTIGTSNNTIHWRETNGVTPSDRTATVTSGSYFPDSLLSSESLASFVGTVMTANSTYGATYTCSVNKQTGLVTIAASGGTLTGFALMLTVGETNKLLSGGDYDPGEQGLNGFGFEVEASVGSYALSVTSPTQTTNAWHPQSPIPESTPVRSRDKELSAPVIQHQTNGGRKVTRDFQGPIAPKDVNYREVLNIALGYLTTADRDSYMTYFYNCYAKTGARFRYFPNRNTLNTYDERVLLLESAQSFKPQREGEGYPYYRFTMKTSLYKA